MMKEFIDSDRVNFLVWRYLLEGNYRETAAKFQKEWHIQEPHRHFDFAPHVKHHALVTVINRGLLYYALEREFAQSQVPQNVPATAEEVPQRGVFGPLTVQPPLAAMEMDEDGEGAAATTISAPTAPVPKEGDVAPAVPAAATATVTTVATASAPEEPAIPAPESAPAPATAPSATKACVDATAKVMETATIDEAENTRKRPLQLSNGSPVKRPRLSNGYENGAGPDSATTPMEIDQQNADNNNHAYPSPLEVEQATTPINRTYGPETGTQVDKVDELASETIFLSMYTEDADAGATVVPPATPPAPTNATEAPLSRSPGQHNNPNNPIVLHCEWNPQDPSILAAAGTDALARVWTISRPTAPLDPVSDHVQTANGSLNGTLDHVTAPSSVANANAAATNGNGATSSTTTNQPFENLIEEDSSPNSVVTAMAWNSEGTAIAVATETGNKARISIWAKDGTHLQRFDVAEPPVIKLKWSPKDGSLLAIAPDNEGTLVTVFDSAASNSVSYFLSSHDLESNPLDAAWINDTEFLVCGGRLLESLRCTEKTVVSTRKFPTRDNDCFTQVQYDGLSKLVATASESGMIDLWDESGHRRSISAHSGSITSLIWQPLRNAPGPEDERMLASGGEDGIVSIWNARGSENKPKWSMTMDPPVVALAFTPDGAFIAGATTDRILIWRIGEYAMPRASWSRTAHPEWLNPKASSGASNVEDTHCLCWDSTGQKLAYGTNSRVAVINFR